MITDKPRISDAELSAFAALYDMLGSAAVPWRATFGPDGQAGYAVVVVEVRVPASMNQPEKNVKVEAVSLRAAVTELGSALVAAAMEGAPES